MLVEFNCHSVHNDMIDILNPAFVHLNDYFMLQDVVLDG